LCWFRMKREGGEGDREKNKSFSCDEKMRFWEGEVNFIIVIDLFVSNHLKLGFFRSKDKLSAIAIYLFLSIEAHWQFH
jgi:hypothetical protein